MESNPLPLQSFVWHVAKDTAFAAEYEDAFSVDLQKGRAAIADGVSSAIFSGRWARLLTRRVVEQPPDLSQPENWGNWLAEPRRLWMEDIDFPRMPIHQKQKLRQVGGSFCTLCWVEFTQIPCGDDGVSRYLLRSVALGDSCLLHIRSGQLLTSFPLKTAEAFDLDPDSICSVATSRDGRQPLITTEFECLDGDYIILVTDAIAKWMITGVENKESPPWETLWNLNETEWVGAIEHLRDTNRMKRDDTTMVIMSLGAGVPPWVRPFPGAEVTVTSALAEQESGISGDEATSKAGSPAVGSIVSEVDQDNAQQDGFDNAEQENDGDGSIQRLESINGLAVTAVSEIAPDDLAESNNPMTT